MHKYIALLFCILLGFTSQASANDAFNNLHILYYESIEFEDDPYQLSDGLPFNNFKDHLAFFKSEAYEVIDFEMLDQLETKSDKKEKNYIVIILNVNDENALKYALPLMKQYGYPVEFLTNFENFKKKSIFKNMNNNIILDVSINGKDINFITKNINNETSSFRNYLYKNIDIVMLDDFIYSDQIKLLLSRYNFDKMLIPTSVGNKVGQHSPYYSYIKMGSGFTNVDIMNVHLNRRKLMHQNLTVNHIVDNETSDHKISWGLTILDLDKNLLSSLTCVDSKNTKSEIFILENRIEIRHRMDKNASSVTVHCTLPIIDKNLNISDTYYYMALHKTLQ